MDPLNELKLLYGVTLKSLVPFQMESNIKRSQACVLDFVASI